MLQMHNRKAIAMIELIFAIVIMGIVLMSAPTLISTATKSGYVGLQQEAIAATASEMGIILTHHWDEGDTDENLSSPILVTDGNADLNEGNDTNGNLERVRVGTSIFSKRTFVTSLAGIVGRLDATTAGNLGPDAGDSDDIDDFISAARDALDDINTTSIEEGDYIDREGIQLTTDVFYINDTPTDGNTYLGSNTAIDFDLNATELLTTTNIKMVTVTLTTTNTAVEMAKEITLKAFSCNIGAYELEEETY